MCHSLTWAGVGQEEGREGRKGEEDDEGSEGGEQAVDMCDAAQALVEQLSHGAGPGGPVPAMQVTNTPPHTHTLVSLRSARAFKSLR